MNDHPLDRAAAFGHTLADDAPFGPTRVLRWTCTSCGRAVLNNGGHYYGSALTYSCSGQGTTRSEP